MKKFLMLLLLPLCLTSCKAVKVVSEKGLEMKLANLQRQVSEEQQKLEELKAMVNIAEDRIAKLHKTEVDVAESKNRVYYIIRFKAKQTHLSLDLSDHLKDAANAYEFEIPVDRDFYESVHEGQELTSSFRAGSMLLCGTFGSNKVWVEKKRKEVKN